MQKSIWQIPVLGTDLKGLRVGNRPGAQGAIVDGTDAAVTYNVTLYWTLHLDLEILGPFPHGVYSLNLVLWMNRRQPGPGRFRVAFTEQMLPWAVLGNEWIRQGEENTQRHGVQRGPLSSRNGEMLICENIASLGWRTGAHVGRRSPYCEDPCIYSKEFGI